MQVLETRKTKLGVDHPQTLRSMANLAHTLKAKGHNIAAYELICASAARSSQVLGPEHPHTIDRHRTEEDWRP